MAGVISSYNTTRHMSYVKNQRHAARNDLLTQTFSRPTNARPLSKSVKTNKKIQNTTTTEKSTQNGQKQNHDTSNSSEPSRKPQNLEADNVMNLADSSEEWKNARSFLISFLCSALILGAIAGFIMFILKVLDQ